MQNTPFEEEAVFTPAPHSPVPLSSTQDSSAEKYRTLFEAIDEGFTIIEVLFDEQETPTDYRFLEINPAFVRHTGIENAIGRRIKEIAPDFEDFWFQTYGRVVQTGEAIRFEHRAEALSRWFDVYALRLGEPQGRQVAVLFTDVTARKILEEERIQMVERERNIALRLQEALTPAIPLHVPGMTLAKYYKAALRESEVGGDFYDVFPVNEHCVTLVVGDLAGKGLAAASQVATVRNMLRYAVYRARTLAGGIKNLNSLLVEQSLLSGFATLFVGAYDSAAGTLRYVNAGQEPALVRRAKTGTVEQLAPTGPVFGGFEDAVYAEEVIGLESGDALAIFTDGLTEVGPSRREMLEADGVAALLQQASRGTAQTAELLSAHLIASIDQFAQGGVTRDDMCLLLGVVG